MSELLVTHFDVASGEVEIRNMNDEELKQYELDQAKAVEKAQAVEAKAAQRQALLDKLGITEEEARLLLGGN